MIYSILYIIIFFNNCAKRGRNDLDKMKKYMHLFILNEVATKMLLLLYFGLVQKTIWFQNLQTVRMFN